MARGWLDFTSSPQVMLPPYLPCATLAKDSRYTHHQSLRGRREHIDTQGKVKAASAIVIFDVVVERLASNRWDTKRRETALAISRAGSHEHTLSKSLLARAQESFSFLTVSEVRVRLFRPSSRMRN